jgi:hypothetical protein
MYCILNARKEENASHSELSKALDVKPPWTSINLKQHWLSRNVICIRIVRIYMFCGKMQPVLEPVSKTNYQAYY